MKYFGFSFCIPLAYWINWINFFSFEKKNIFFSSHLIEIFVPLASPKVLPLGNKMKNLWFFILYFAHLFVPLQA